MIKLNKDQLRIKELLHLELFTVFSELPLKNERQTDMMFTGDIFNDPAFKALYASFGKKYLHQCSFIGGIHKSVFIPHFIDPGSAVQRVIIYSLSDYRDKKTKQDLKLFKEFIGNRCNKVSHE